MHGHTSTKSDICHSLFERRWRRAGASTDTGHDSVCRHSRAPLSFVVKSDGWVQLCNVPAAPINMCEQLKDEIWVQLQNDVVQEFDVGYFQGSTSISNSYFTWPFWDTEWCEPGEKVTFWCEGLKQIKTPVPKSQDKKCSVDLRRWWFRWTKIW